MLNLDINHLSYAELEEAVYYYCSQCGTVKNIKLHGLSDGSDCEVAAVEMSTTEETERLFFNNIGDLKFGDMAIVRLAGNHGSAGGAPVKGGGDASGAAPPDAREPIEILLVEDNPLGVRLTKEALKAAGIPHNLHVVDDGLDAMLFLHSSRRFDDVPAPDIILLVNLELPSFHTDDALTELRACETLYNVPVVVLMGSGAGVNPHEMAGGVTKPRDVAALVREIRKVEVLARHRKNRKLNRRAVIRPTRERRAVHV